MPDGQVIRPYMTAAVDVFSGSVVGFLIHGGAPSSTDHAVLFARIVSPRRAVDRLDPSLTLGRSKTLPSESMIAMGQATPDAPAMPFIAVETLTMDRGKDFLASRAAAEVPRMERHRCTSPLTDGQTSRRTLLQQCEQPASRSFR